MADRRVFNIYKVERFMHGHEQSSRVRLATRDWSDQPDSERTLDRDTLRAGSG